MQGCSAGRASPLALGPQDQGPCTPTPRNAPEPKIANKLRGYLEGLISPHNSQFNVFATRLNHLGRKKTSDTSLKAMQLWQMPQTLPLEGREQVTLRAQPLKLPVWQSLPANRRPFFHRAAVLTARPTLSPDSWTPAWPSGSPSASLALPTSTSAVLTKPKAPHDSRPQDSLIPQPWQQQEPQQGRVRGVRAVSGRVHPVVPVLPLLLLICALRRALRPGPGLLWLHGGADTALQQRPARASPQCPVPRACPQRLPSGGLYTSCPLLFSPAQGPDFKCKRTSRRALITSLMVRSSVSMASSV